MHLSAPRQAALLAGITLAVFATTLSSGFVYDARMQVLTDPFLHDSRNWWPVLTFQTLAMDVLDFNRPVNLASQMLDATIWGREPFGFHLTSVLLHTGTVLLVWALLRRLAPGIGQFTAIVATLLFAVHPLVTEAVCEPSYREDLLVGFFTLAALWLATGRVAPWRSAAIMACCLLAIGSKESGIAAAASVIIVWLLFHRAEPGWFWPVTVGGATVVVAAFLTARFLLEPANSRIFTHRPEYLGGSLGAALLVEPRILALYAQLVLWPVNLCADYTGYSIAYLPLPVAAVIVGAILVAAGLAVRADRRMAVAIALVVVPLLTVANIVPIYRPAADRYMYLPMAGIGLAVGLLLDGPWLATRGRLRDRLLLGCMAAAVVLGMACMQRQKVWASPLALWTDTHARNPFSYNGAVGFAEAQRRAGRFADAEQAARRAIAITAGGQGDAWATLALILEAQGRTGEAFSALDKAIELDASLADPEGCVAVMAMEREFAADLIRLQSRRRGEP